MWRKAFDLGARVTGIPVVDADGPFSIGPSGGSSRRTRITFITARARLYGTKSRSYTDEVYDNAMVGGGHSELSEVNTKTTRGRCVTVRVRGKKT